MKSGLGNRGRLAFGTTHVASLEFPHETGHILRCAAKVMKPLQTKHAWPLLRKACFEIQVLRLPRCTKEDKPVGNFNI